MPQLTFLQQMFMGSMWFIYILLCFAVWMIEEGRGYASSGDGKSKE